MSGPARAGRSQNVPDFPFIRKTLEKRAKIAILSSITPTTVFLACFMGEVITKLQNIGVRSVKTLLSR